MKRHGYFELSCKSKNGNLLWQDGFWNSLANEGELAMLDLFFRNGNAPTGFSLALFNDTPVDTDTLADLIDEPLDNGYARHTIARNSTDWPILVLDAGDYQITSKNFTFTAIGGSIGPITYAVLIATIATVDKLIAYGALSQARTLSDGDSLDVIYALKLA